MSNEINVNLSMTVNNPSTGGGYQTSFRVNQFYTQNALGVNAEVLALGTSPTTLPFSNLTTYGWSYLQNLDAVNYLSYGVQGQAIAAPVANAPTTTGTGGTLAAATYYYKVTALTLGGETTPSNEVSVTTTGSTSQNTLTWGAVSGATGYNVYRATTSGAEKLLATVGAVTTYTDTGAVNPGTTSPPGSNTTSFYPLGKLKAGEVALLRLFPGITFQAMANTAPVELNYLVLQD